MIDTNAAQFERKGDRWDNRPLGRKHAVVSAVQELAARELRHHHAEGYVGAPLNRPVKHGRDFRAPVAGGRPVTLKMIEAAAWRRLTTPATPEPAPLPHHLLSEREAPKKGDSWEPEAIQAEIDRLERAHLAEMEKFERRRAL